MISAIVVNWNGCRYLDGCLRALLAQRYPAFEVLLVDNGSTDGSVDYVRAHFPRVGVIAAPTNLGFAAGNNLGFAQARGELLALVNNDTTCDPDWLAALARAVAPADVAAASGKFFALDDPTRVTCTLPLLNRYTASARWTVEDAPVRDVHYASGAGMLVKRAVVEQVGLLDPDYGAYYEETDWCARMIVAGYRVVYTPEATMRHQQGGSTSAATMRYYLERNRIRFALKNFDLPYLALFAPLYLAGVLRRARRGGGAGRGPARALVARAIWWNLRQLPRTLRARRRDRGHLPSHRSYNRSLG
ncbi:MAG TPA: glycosyltransferase family 2 protein [Thermomicrobiales bacterium]|nr:glycosyltransferase family 2 protein [Thermomicrobiales bacterium]